MKIVITGNTRGIGRSLSELLRGAGHTVIGMSRGGDYIADFTLPTEAVKAMQRLLIDHPDVDVLVNNAGLVEYADLHHTEKDTEVLIVNLVTPLLLCGEILPFFRRRGHGLILNVGSSCAVKGDSVSSASSAAYVASKHGIRGLHNKLLLETKDEPISAELYHPDRCRTDMCRARADYETLPDPEEHAVAILHIILQHAET
jgi:short-subunit dehydrogenase